MSLYCQYNQQVHIPWLENIPRCENSYWEPIVSKSSKYGNNGCNLFIMGFKLYGIVSPVKF